jgi:hypothetical protein
MSYLHAVEHATDTVARLLHSATWLPSRIVKGCAAIATEIETRRPNRELVYQAVHTSACHTNGARIDSTPVFGAPSSRVARRRSFDRGCTTG